MEKEYEYCEGFDPIIDENSKILILGTLPSNESIENYKKTGNQDYYKDSRNRFWKVISQLFLDGKDIKTESYEYKKELLLNNYIALWDVLKSADRPKGKSKDDFKNPTSNDIKSILEKYPNISYVYFNGKGKALNYFNKFNHDIYIEFPQITFAWLYSTSGNNGNFKIEQWENALKICEKEVVTNNNNEVISYFKNLYDEIKNTSINEQKASEYLQQLCEKAINGFPGFSDSVDKLVNDYLKEYKNPEVALKELIKNQVIKCTTSGFITGCPGLLAIPIALPANICSVLYIQLRMIAAIAKIRGYDIYSDQVQTFVFSCLVKGGIIDVVKDTGIKIGNKVSYSILKKHISGKMLTAINKKIGTRVITKFGEKGIINLVKILPLVGGVIGGGIDYLYTKDIANNACKLFTKIK